MSERYFVGSTIAFFFAGGFFVGAVILFFSLRVGEALRELGFQRKRGWIRSTEPKTPLRPAFRLLEQEEQETETLVEVYEPGTEWMTSVEHRKNESGG